MSLGQRVTKAWCSAGTLCRRARGLARKFAKRAAHLGNFVNFARGPGPERLFLAVGQRLRTCPVVEMHLIRGRRWRRLAEILGDHLLGLVLRLLVVVDPR